MKKQKRTKPDTKRKRKRSVRPSRDREGREQSDVGDEPERLSATRESNRHTEDAVDHLDRHRVGYQQEGLQDDDDEDEDDIVQWGLTLVPRLLSSLKKNRGVYVPRDLCELVGDASQALVLAQILYWFDETNDCLPRTRAEFKGKLFLAKTHEELGNETGLTARRVKSCIAALRASGLIFVEYHMFNDKRVSYLVPNVEEISRRLDRLRGLL